MFKVKRFVTGLNEQGQSAITFDDTAENILEVAGWPGLFLTDIWITSETPAVNDGLEDRAERTIRHDPAPNGTIFRVVEFPPENSLAEKPDIAAIFESMGSENIPSADDSAQHASMHFTNSIDYLSILSGEVSMVLQDGEVLLKQGDCIVQRGTKHGFINRGDVPCVISVVLVDAKPISQV